MRTRITITALFAASCLCIGSAHCQDSILTDSLTTHPTVQSDTAAADTTGQGTSSQASGEGDTKTAGEDSYWFDQLGLGVIASLIAAIVFTILAVLFRHTLKKLFIPLYDSLRKILLFSSFRERYFRYLIESRRHVQAFGLKMRATVSIDLKKIYVPLKVYRESERVRDYLGDIEDQTPSPVDDERAEHRLHREMTRRRGERPIDIADVLKERKKVLILGGPGCGKTTFLDYVALTFAMNRQREWLGVDRRRIPICIPCRDIKRRGLPRIDDLHQWCLPDMLQNYSPGGFFKTKLDKGHCVILLDGLDEVPTVKDREAIAKWIHDLTTVYSKNQFIVTSRAMGYKEAPLQPGFDTYYVSDFDNDNVSSFVKKWYDIVETTLEQNVKTAQARAEKEAADLIEAINRHDRIRRLAVNPLLLSIIATVHRYAGRLPKNRAELYDDCVDLLLGSKDEALDIPLRLHQKEKLQVLKPLAYHMHCRETRDISRQELEERLEGPLRSVGQGNVTVDSFIEEVKNRSGLLVERGQGIFSFSHLTFQEYLTALHLKEQSSAVDFLISKKDRPWWRETILLWCGMVDVTKFVKRLLECREDILLSNLRLAGFCIGDALSLELELRRTVVDKLYDCYWSIGIDKLRKEAQDALVATKDEKLADRLIARLDDDDFWVRYYAGDALSQTGNEKAVDELIARLDDDESTVRQRAADALRQVGSEKAVGKLIALLDDTEPAVHFSAAYALGQIGSEKAVEKLIALLDDDNVSVCSSAAEALGQIGSEKAVDKLITLLDNDDWNVYSSVADALVNIGNEKGVDAVAARLDDDDWNIRSRAAYALRQIGNEKAVEGLIALLGDGDSTVRSRAAYALGRIGSEKAVEMLIALLDDDDSSVRSAAAEALGHIGCEKAVEKLIARLRDDVSLVRRDAAYALGQIGSGKAVDTLIALLRDEAGFVRYTVAVALGKIGGERAVNAVRTRLHKGRPHYAYVGALYEYFKKHRTYIDELPDEMIERNHFWKENVKRDAPC